MNENLIKEAVWCYRKSTPECFKTDPKNASRYMFCLHELFIQMTNEELNKFNSIKDKTTWN